MKIRLFIEENITDNMILIGDHHHYLANVLRVKKNHEVFLFNHNGEYLFYVDLVNKKNIVLIKIKKTDNFEIKSEIVSCLPLIKPDTMSKMVRQSVEMGAEKIILFNSKHSSVRNINIDKIRLIAIEALEQCGRILLPEIIFLNSLEELIKNSDFEIFYANEKSLVKSIDLSLKIDNKIGVIIGPEGGFSDSEFEILTNYNSVNLGRHILRSDTALINMLLIAKILKNNR